MYKSKYPSLIDFLTNQEDLILLDSEIQNIENLIDKDLKKQCDIHVVIESAFIEVFDKADCIQHWHNTGKNDEGMVVSSKHVHELWEVLSKYRDYRDSL